MWVATREGYTESGCNFMLQPFTDSGESYGNNITSVVFGVSKRYTDDPPPASYNFVIPSPLSSASVSATTAPSTPAATRAGSGSTSSPTSTSMAQASHGLSKARKIGIGLGVPLGVLLIAVFIGGFYLHRRKRRRGETGEVPAAIQPSDKLSPLPDFMYKDPPSMRQSRTETMSPLSQLSRDDPMSEGTERRRSELMSDERAELG